MVNGVAVHRLGWSALGYAAAGLPVFPCEGKEPRVAGGFKSASKDPAQITDWWQRWPDAAIGIPTGAASGVSVLDVDARHGGLATLAEIIREHGPLPDGPVVITGGGGLHYWFGHHDGLRCKSGVLPGIDVRAGGGYVIAAPSIHTSGVPYRWHPCDWDISVPLPAPPDWLLLDCRRVGHNIPEGRRNMHLTSFAGSLRRQGMAEDAILAALLEENAGRCRPELDAGEVARIAHSIAGYPSGYNDDGVHLTDLGNAGRLAQRHGHDIRYVHNWGRWLTWDGTRWCEDDTGGVQRMAKDTVRHMYTEAPTIEDDRRRGDVVRWALASESAARIKSMVTLTASEPDIPILPRHLDADGWVLNTPNGTVDLKTGVLRPHDRLAYITKVTGTTYDPQACAPLFEAFLSRATGTCPELADYMQRAVGYSISGDVSEHVIHVPYGPSASGKTTFLETIAATLGDYAMAAAPGLLTSHGDRHPTDVADLFGARFVSSSEIGEGKWWNEELVKRLTGGDTVKARRMREDFWAFRPTHKLWIATNTLPDLQDGGDSAIWRRMRVLPFAVVIPEGERDRDLPSKLRAEMPGILAWAVRGCLKWQQVGLLPPPPVLIATQGYRDDADIVGRFVQDCCVLDPDGRERAGALYNTYADWAAATAEQAMSKTRFGRRLRDRGLTQHSTAQARYWCGIRLNGSAAL